MLKPSVYTVKPALCFILIAKGTNRLLVSYNFFGERGDLTFISVCCLKSSYVWLETNLATKNDSGDITTTAAVIIGLILNINMSVPKWWQRR